MLLARLRVAPAIGGVQLRRLVSTIPTNQHIKLFPNAALNSSHVLTYLGTSPPSADLAIGTTTENPPTPRSFSENPKFHSILYDVLSKHAAQDPLLQSQAQAFAAPGGATLASGGAFSAPKSTRKGSKGAGDGGGGASTQGGAGGGGMGGHVHLSDLRNPPDYGRIAWPEDILGSIEADGHGNIVGEFQPSGTYRIITNEGILGLSDFMRKKLIERLEEEEKRS